MKQNKIQCTMPNLAAKNNCRWLYDQNNCAGGPPLCPFKAKQDLPQVSQVHQEFEELMKKCQEQYSQACNQLAQSLGVTESPADNVNHPAYYTDGSIEVSDFIADKNLNFFRGNVLKYICRAGKKNAETEVEDLQKARWYIDREIERLGGK